MNADDPSGTHAARLTPLRAREFFAQPWTGQGRYRPPIIGRIWSLRFSFSSRCDFADDTMWTVTDETRFANGRSETRTMHAQLVAADRIRLAASDLPDGAVVHLGRRGFRFDPYKLTLRRGPLRLTLRCHDRCWLDPDDALHDEIRLSLHGLPAGRLELLLHREPLG